MRTPTSPTYAELTTVPLTDRMTVSAEHVDGNSHMNVRHIYGFGVSGADALSEEAGIDDSYRAGGEMGTFAAEHHITYLAEINQGAVVGTRPVWIDRSQRAAHIAVLITDESTRQLAAVLELLVVNINLTTRRPQPFPDDVSQQIDLGIAAKRSLEFGVPSSGAIGVRRP